MNILKKSSLLVLILLLSGCAHHSGYYSGHSDFGAVGISIDARIPLQAYSRHYQHDTYRPRSIRRRHRNYNSHHDSRHYDRYGYYRSNRYGSKHGSNHSYDRHYRDYSHYRTKKRRDRHWGGRGSRLDHVRDR